MSSVIVYLLRSTKSDVIDIIKSLNSIYLNFVKSFNYPIIIFVESNFTEEYKSQIINNIPFEISFENIKFKTYEELNDTNIQKILKTHDGSQLWPIGYRHMCRFWSGDFLNNNILKKYKYVWRMDSDAYILKKINYDIFLNMKEKNLSYTYSNICDDESEVCNGLYEFSKKFFTEKNINFKWDLYKMFTTHVEIIDTEIFKNSIYFDYYNKIDQTNFFYLKRWGDAPIRYIAITNLNFKTEILNIEYYHGNDGSGRREQLQIPD
jgi:hypothetical protein